MAQPQHLVFPVRLTSAGNLATVEQDSDAEIANAIAISMSYTRGTRRGSPRFGIPEVLFDEAPLDLNAVSAAVQEDEPRARTLPVLTDRVICGGVEHVDLDFDPRQA